MNLYVFPEIANLSNGYSIAVFDAYNRLKPTEDDVVVWYTLADPSKNYFHRPSDIYLYRSSVNSFRTIKNVILNRVHSELHPSDFSFLQGYNFDHIHCDEVVFYRALRKLYPNANMTVRFHNCFSRIRTRNEILKRSLGLKYTIIIRSMKPLERELFCDKKCKKIFLSNEDRDYYTSMTGIYDDSEVWSFLPDMSKVKANRTDIDYNLNLVWFGGIEAHKICSIRWFINEILPTVRKSIPNVEFHLWGRNTNIFNNPGNKVYGHGIYYGEGYPMRGALYVNPDIIGGGVKVKLLNLIENGIPFITTVFGFEGYPKSIIDNKYCMVVQEKDWANYIVGLLQSRK